MLKLDKLGCALMMALLASCMLASLALVAQAWWYTEWRVYESAFIGCERQSFACGYKWTTQVEHRKWRCNDKLGYCYDTREKRVEIEVSACRSDCPLQASTPDYYLDKCVGYAPGNSHD